MNIKSDSKFVDTSDDFTQLNFSKEEKKKLKEKQGKYAKYVKEMYQPVVSEKK